MTKIANVSIRALRGIRTEIALQLNKKSLVVRGDNGTGKSSIVHGLRWALRGDDPPSADATGDTAESLRRNVLEKEPSAPRVVVELSPQGRIEITPQGVTADEAGDVFRQACIRANPFLRRPDLLGFLTAKPGERFKYLEAFLDLEVADGLRDGLIEHAKQASNECEEKKRELDALLKKAAALLPVTGRSPASWEQLRKSLALYATSVEVDMPSDASWDELATRGPALEATLTGETIAKRRAEITALLQRLREIEQVADAAPLLAKTRALEAKTGFAGISKLLGEAANYLRKAPATQECPVCEQDVVHDNLLSRLDERQLELGEAAQATAGLDRLGNEWRVYVTRVGDARSECARCLDEAMPPHAFASKPVAPGRAAIETLVAEYGEGYASVAAAAVAAWTEALEAALSHLPSELKAEEHRSYLRAVRHAVEHRLPIEVCIAERDDLDRSAMLLKSATDAMKKARQQVAQLLLNEIGQLVEKFYCAIHPPGASDEVTGAPTIEIQGHGGGTAYIRGTFQTKTVDNPQWVYSDGHLDTVGICIFLALRRFRADRDKGRDPMLMVLDDVILSIDLGHARRFLEVIRDFFDDHQVLILTHNGLFTGWCEHYLPSFERHVIRRWSLEDGPSFGLHKTTIARLRLAISDESSEKLLAQAIMNLLDEWIVDARYEFGLSAPARRGDEYTLSDLWVPFRSKVLEITKKHPLGGARAALEQIPDVVMMRNRLAAHENEFAKEFPLQALRDIGNSVLAVVDSLYCGTCVRFTAPIPAMGTPVSYQCRCEALRYIRPQKSQPIS